MTGPNNVEYGDPHLALPNEILCSVVGSGLHGIAIEDAKTETALSLN